MQDLQGEGRSRSYFPSDSHVCTGGGGGSGRMEGGEERQGQEEGGREGWRAGVRMGAGTAEKSRCRKGQEEKQSEKRPLVKSVRLKRPVDDEEEIIRQGF